MNTTVVNIYKEPYDVYIGRAGKGQDGYWGNPFQGPDRVENIDSFRKYFYDRIRTDPMFARKLRTLKGKRLGCFCKPKSCHGDVIAEYLDRLPDDVPVRLAVVGSRTFSDYEFMKSILQWYTIKEIISGGASGADSLAERYADENGIPKKVFLPDWKRLGKGAGFARNEKIVAAADEVVAFWDGSSHGTRHTIEIAEKQSKPVATYWPQSKPDIPHDEISCLG